MWSVRTAEAASIHPLWQHTHYYGLIDPAAIPPDSPAGGIGQIDTGNGEGPEARYAAVGQAGANTTMAHEIGHNLGREHTCGTGDEEDCVDYYAHPGGIIGVYGVDLADPSAPVYLPPDTTYDLMSYLRPRWPSDITFSALEGWFVEGGHGYSAQPSAPAADQEYLLARGTIRDGLVILNDAWYRLMLPAGTSDEVGHGAYSLELQDHSGAALFTRYFRLTHVEGGLGHFEELIPWQQGTARIVLKEGQTVLLVVRVSAHAPEVTLLQPNGGEAWPPYGKQTVTWSGSDADGDPLHYMLQYSPDGGNTWTGIAAGLTGESYTLDVGNLPGSKSARLRVIASDGVNTALDESDAAFAVEGKAPKAMIVYPMDVGAFPPGGPVILEGAATDLEDGPLTDDSRFTWRSSLQGLLGVGRKFQFRDLRPGRHTIILGGDRTAMTLLRGAACPFSSGDARSCICRCSRK